MTVIHVNFRREPEVELTKDELAQRLGYSRRHVEKLTALGMPSRLVGIQRLYKETECRNWLSRHDRREAAHAG